MLNNLKPYIKLILKCLLVLTPLIFFCFYAEDYMLEYVDHEAPYYIWNKDVCRGKYHDREFDVIILGDSVSNGAYAPEVFSDATVNLSLGGTTPVENYYILKEYLENNKLPKVVYLSFTDGHLGTEDNFYERTVYTHRFSFPVLCEIIKNALYYEEDSIIKRNWIKDFISYELYLPNKYVTAILKAGFNERLEKNLKNTDSIELHRGRYISTEVNMDKSDKTKNFTDFTVAPLFDEYYNKIIKLCQDNNIIIRAVKTPMDNDCVFTEEYEKMFYAYYQQLMDKYDNLTVDWVKGNWGSHYFKDDKHMNNRGARAFSETLESMYPDDFSQDISDDMYGIFDRDVEIETDCCEIFEWINHKEYTVLIHDGTDNLEKLFKKYLRNDTGLNLYKTSYQNVYFVSGENDGELIFTIESQNNTHKITAPNGVTCDLNPIDDGEISLYVMDDRLGTLVTNKSYRLKKDFILKEE